MKDIIKKSEQIGKEIKKELEEHLDQMVVRYGPHSSIQVLKGIEKYTVSENYEDYILKVLVDGENTFNLRLERNTVTGKFDYWEYDSPSRTELEWE